LPEVLETYIVDIVLLERIGVGKDWPYSGNTFSWRFQWIFFNSVNNAHGALGGFWTKGGPWDVFLA